MKKSGGETLKENQMTNGLSVVVVFFFLVFVRYLATDP